MFKILFKRSFAICSPKDSGYATKILLSAFSVMSGLVTEAIKKLVNDKANFSYNILALCVALIVGCVGCGLYYQLNEILFTINNIIYI